MFFLEKGSFREKTGTKKPQMAPVYRKYLQKCNYDVVFANSFKITTVFQLNQVCNKISTKCFIHVSFMVKPTRNNLNRAYFDSNLTSIQGSKEGEKDGAAIKRYKIQSLCSRRINLSPFTKDFRVQCELFESKQLSIRPDSRPVNCNATRKCWALSGTGTCQPGLA